MGGIVKTRMLNFHISWQNGKFKMPVNFSICSKCVLFFKMPVFIFCFSTKISLLFLPKIPYSIPNIFTTNAVRIHTAKSIFSSCFSTRFIVTSKNDYNAIIFLNYILLLWPKSADNYILNVRILLFQQFPSLVTGWLEMKLLLTFFYTPLQVAQKKRSPTRVLKALK